MFTKLDFKMMFHLTIIGGTADTTFIYRLLIVEGEKALNPNMWCKNNLKLQDFSVNGLVFKASFRF